MLKKLSLLILDVAALYGALAVALWIRYRDNLGGQFSLHALPFSILFVLWVLTFFAANLYDTRELRNDVRFFSALSRSMVVAAGFAIALFYFIPFFGISPRTNLFLFLIITAILQVGIRSLFNQIISRSFKKAIAIVGVNAQSIELAEFIVQNPQLGYRLAYLIDIAEQKELIPQSTQIQIHQLREAEDTIQRGEIDIIVISPEAYQTKQVIDLFYASLAKRIAFYNLASFYERATGKVPLGAINQVWFLENASGHKHVFYETFKRFTDIVMASLLGIIFILLLPFIASVVYINSPGKIFYRQKRVGRGGKIINITKIRSMKPDAEAETGAVWTQENDPRITSIGKFLRTTRLDEFPQLWSVLKGEMSFVGPRAERPEFHDTLKASIPFYEERYLIKPGLAGVSQLHLYGASIADAAEKLQYDLYYIKNRSLMLDLGIILKTIALVLRAGGR